MHLFIKNVWVWDGNINKFWWRNEWYHGSLEESCLLVKGVSETILNEAKEQKGRLLSILLVTLGASLLWNLWTGKGVIRRRWRNI